MLPIIVGNTEIDGLRMIHSPSHLPAFKVTFAIEKPRNKKKLYHAILLQPNLIFDPGTRYDVPPVLPLMDLASVHSTE